MFTWSKFARRAGSLMLPLVFAACSPSPKMESAPAVPPPAPVVSPQQSRAQSADKRFAAAGEAGRLIEKAIAHHGGLQAWYDAGLLHFRFRYEPVADPKTARDTKQWVDTWSSRAVHTLTDKPEVSFGWDGKTAWFVGSRDEMPNPRFWSLTPFYFLGIPFVLADEGVVLTMADDVAFEGHAYKQVRATFKADAGDSPDDYYLVLIDADTGRVGGVRYVVSYPGFFEKGKTSPESLMLYDGEREVPTGDGKVIRLAEGMHSFQMDGDKLGKQKTNVTIDDVYFASAKRPAPSFAQPKTSNVQQGWR